VLPDGGTAASDGGPSTGSGAMPAYTPPATAPADDGAAFPAPDTTALDAAERATGCCRDWTTSPAVVQAQPAGRLYAVSDIHGGYERVATLLKAAGLVTGIHTGHLQWTGGDAVLVIVGDNIDKGDRSVDTLDLAQTLEWQAPAYGGRVVTCLGNHEAEFLADPENSKADPLRAELAARGVTAETFASTSDRHGRFLRRMPVAAVVAGWFFAHAGSTAGKTIDQLAAAFQTPAQAGSWGDAAIIGSDSPLEARDWWSKSVLKDDLAALGAKHIVMGHDPNAFSEKGMIAAHFEGRLVHIDTGLSPAVDNSKGLLLRVDAPGTAGETASAVDHNGGVTALDLTQS
jgi:hypothetical protein